MTITTILQINRNFVIWGPLKTKTSNTVITPSKTLYLADQTVEIGVGWSLNIQVPPADVIDCFIVDHEGTVRMLQGGVGGQDGVVRLDHCGGNLRGWVD